VGALAEHHAAALCGIELFGTARPVHKVGVIGRIDHAHRAVFAAFGKRTCARDRRIE
jgi:hypothetical protein